jgi:glycerol transport system substrate-binding protein
VDAGPQAARGDIAQRIFQYVTWLSDDNFHIPGSPVVARDGTRLWRVAPTPHGRYWDEGMKVGYQDAGSWTIPANVRGQRRAMAWLWAQFCVSKTVSLEKFLEGGTPVRKSTIFSDYLTDRIEEWGGLVEFYRSEERKKWTDTGPNVPDYPKLSGFWWPNIARAIAGEVTPQEAMDAIAESMDEAMGNMRMARYSPRLNREHDTALWLASPGAPKGERPEQEPRTIPYDELLEQWTQE